MNVRQPIHHVLSMYRVYKLPQTCRTLVTVSRLLSCCSHRGNVKRTMDMNSWNYSDLETWKSVKGWAGEGQRQSPIDIDTKNLLKSNELGDLKLTNFDKSLSGTWSNAGNSIRFDPASGSPTVLFQNHRGVYELQQFHFHWGATGSQGSEHTIDGQTYSGELHFVTRKTTVDATAGDAFAVLGVLLVSDNSMSATGSWKELLDNIPTQNQKKNSVSAVQPADLLPSSLSYYHYEGSLTTPPCSEIVQWFLLRSPLNVPSAFLDSLRNTVTGMEGQSLCANFRKPQPLNGRQVMVQGDNS